MVIATVRPRGQPATHENETGQYMSMKKTRRGATAKSTTIASTTIALASVMAAFAVSGSYVQNAAAQSVTVAENRIINRVAFEGNRRLRSEALLPDMQTRANTAYNPATVAADTQRITDVYRRTGRALAQVTPRIVQLPNGTVDVVFTINEGSRTTIKSIDFEGNNAFSDSRLRDIMTSEQSGILTLLKTTDVYDPDRVAADLELIRRYYLRRGYADIQIVSSDVVFDAQRGGYLINIVLNEGQQYTVGSVNVDSRLPGIDNADLQRRVLTRAGRVYDATEVERTLVDLTTEVSRRGYPFAQVRPVGVRNVESATVDIAYVLEEGPRVYVERINVRGNTRTQEGVIRRELDLGEGDPYNKVLLDRAERRLNNLGFFESVRISNEPSMSPDRVIINIDVEDKPTGSFSVAGGYSTADGFIGEVSLAENNFLGRGQAVRIAGQLGQRARGVDFSFTEPFFLGYRLAAGIDLFSKFSDETNYARYENRMTGGTLRLGVPITEAFSVTARYSLFEQNLTIPNTAARPFNDCTVPLPGNAAPTPPPQCFNNGEASLAVKESAGRTMTSLVGLTLTYNTLDNFQNPTSGIFAEIRPEVAGLGGDARFFRVSADARYYHELFEDVIGVARVQGGHVRGFGSRQLRIVDHYFMGPSLVRGFENSGIGPRDVSTTDAAANAIGGTTYFGASLEVQFPMPILPRTLGMKGAVFADAGTLFDYKGNTQFPRFGNQTITVRDDRKLRSSVGVGLLWNSPFGPIRFDYAVATTKAQGDRTQAFRFSGGTSF
jgi:outer membrane protein insertion porin family